MMGSFTISYYSPVTKLHKHDKLFSNLVNILRTYVYSKKPQIKHQSKVFLYFLQTIFKKTLLTK
jgi:hypothetical protein